MFWIKADLEKMFSLDWNKHAIFVISNFWPFLFQGHLRLTIFISRSFTPLPRVVGILQEENCRIRRRTWSHGQQTRRLSRNLWGTGKLNLSEFMMMSRLVWYFLFCLLHRHYASHEYFSMQFTWKEHLQKFHVNFMW